MAKVYKFDKAVLKREIEILETSINSLTQEYEYLLQFGHEQLAQTLKVELDRLKVSTAQLRDLAEKTD